MEHDIPGDVTGPVPTVDRAPQLAHRVIAAVAIRGGWGPASGSTSGDGGPLPPAAADLLDELAVAPLGPEALGRVYEVALDPTARSAGAHYTPLDVAARLVAVTAPATLLAGPCRVWDPACGGGAFLLAAAEALRRAGHPPERVLELLWGTDLDPGAVAVTGSALRRWAAVHGASDTAGPHVAVGDGLLDPPPGDGEFDLVVGNPPFQGQLTGGSVRSPEVTAGLRERWGTVVGPYTDTAAVFLVAAATALAPGGRAAMVMPMSVLAARDAGPARSAATALAPLVGLWVAGEPIFDAAVDVCAPVLARAGTPPDTARPANPHPGCGSVVGGAPGVDGPTGPSAVAHPANDPLAGAAATSTRADPIDPADPAVPVVARWRGRGFEPVAAGGRGTASAAAADTASWAPLALAPLGIPDPVIAWSGRLGDLATAAAGFRDEYYGLVGHVHEAPTGVEPGDPGWPDHLAPLVTSGLVEPGHCAWGRRPVRFARRRYERPVVDLLTLGAAGGRAATWATTQARPKVVVATQTRFGEAAVDDHGRWVASTPTVSVTAPPERLWEVAAVVCSPVASVVALAATVGSGRRAGVIKHSVRSVLDLPLPVDQQAWAAGARALRHGDRSRFVAAMAAAYAVVEPEPLASWWAVDLHPTPVA